MAEPFPINRIILTGQVCEAPSVHYLAPNYPEVRLRLLTQEEIPTHGGSQSYTRELWHQLVARGASGIQIEQGVHTGSTLSVVGRIEYHRDTDRFGVTKSVTEILVEQVYIHPQGSSTPSPAPAEAPSPTRAGFDAGRYAPSDSEGPL